MAVRIFYHTNNVLVLATGFESGHAAVTVLDATSNIWKTIYLSHPHSQPLLSLDVVPDRTCFFTSSADAIIAKHNIPDFESGEFQEFIHMKEATPTQIVKTGHSGQQDLKVRDDGKIFATAGWDGRARVYSVTTMKELAVLKWHKLGCYTLAFADVTTHGINSQAEPNGEHASTQLTHRDLRLTPREERTRKAISSHWLIVGSKDTRVSLWEIH